MQGVHNEGEVAEGVQVRGHRLARRAERKVIAGVAGGLADQTGMPPSLVRILFVILSGTGGIGLLLYLVAWLMIPKVTEGSSIAQRLVHRFRTHGWIGIILLVVAAVLVGSNVDVWNASLLWAGALIALGIAVLREDPPRATPTPASESTTEVFAADNFPPPTATLRAPRPHRPRSPLGLITIAAALLAVGGAAVLDNLGSLQLDVGRYFALALLVLGIGLMVGTLWGRAKLMILLGLLLLPGVLLSSLIHQPLQGAIGSREFYPRSVERVSQGYQLSIGRMFVDLSDVPFKDGVTRVPVSMAAGELDVLVPRSVRVDFTGAADLGELWAFGKRHDGTDLRLDGSFGKAESKKRLILDVRAGVGSVSVHWNDYYYGRGGRRAEKRQNDRANERRNKDKKRNEREQPRDQKKPSNRRKR